MSKSTSGSSMFINFAKVLSFLIYAYFIIATTFLIIGFFLLLFGANPGASFVKFVYHFAAVFLQPFREIFPGHQLSDRSYFSGSALFAIIIYGVGAMALHSFITYLTLKQEQNQQALDEIQENDYSSRRAPVSQPTRSTSPPRKVPKI